MARLALSLLGPFELRIGGEPVRRIEANKVRALLAYLTVEYHHAHRRETIGELLWPERPKDAVHNNLRKALFKLRQAIGDAEVTPSYLLTTQKTIQWNAASDCWVDVTIFESLIGAVREHHHPRLETCDACRGLLKQAVELYCGDFLADVYLEDSTEFEDWAIVKRESLRRHALEALEKLSAYHEERGEYSEAVGYARHRTMLDPLSEDTHRHLTEMLARAGQRSEALAQYRICCDILAKELDLEPCEETIRLRDRILSGEFQRAGARPAASTDNHPSQVISAASFPNTDSTPAPVRLAEASSIVVTPRREKRSFSRVLMVVLSILAITLLAGTAAIIRRSGGSMGGEGSEEEAPSRAASPFAATPLTHMSSPTVQSTRVSTSGIAADPSATPGPWDDVVIPPNGVLRIAALGPATGSLAALFDRMCASMKLAGREYGQVHNLEVSFVLFDTRGDQSSALAAAQAIAAEPSIVAVIGPVTSSDGFAVLPVLEDAHVLSISPSATRHNLTALAPTTFNRIILNQYQPGSSLGLEVDELPDVQAFYTAHPELMEGLTAETRVFVPLTYDATMLLLMKLNEVAVVTSDGSVIIGRQALVDAIRSTTDYPGVTGSITIDETGNRAP